MAKAMRAARRLDRPSSSGLRSCSRYLLSMSTTSILSLTIVAQSMIPAVALAAPAPVTSPAGAPVGTPGKTTPETSPTPPAPTGLEGDAPPRAPTPVTQPGSTATRPAEASDDIQVGDEVGNGSDDADNDGNVAVIARAGLEIDTTAAGPSGPVMLSRMEELGNLELRRAEILPRRAGDDPVIHVRVEVRGDEGDTYAIFSEVTVRGKALEGSAREVVCSLCTEGEAVERARSELLRLVPFVRARFRAAAAAKPKEEAPKPVVVPPPDTRLRAGGKAGIGLLAGGTVLLGAGIGLALTEPRPDPNDPLREINIRPVGYAVLGVGAAAIVTGAVLLILDRRKVRRVAQLAPMLERGSAGLLLVGSF